MGKGSTNVSSIFFHNKNSIDLSIYDIMHMKEEDTFKLKIVTKEIDPRTKQLAKVSHRWKMLVDIKYILEEPPISQTTY